MNKYIKLLIISIFIGSILGFIFYKDLLNEVKALSNNNYEITLFQTGVFKSESNAIEYANMFNNYYIYKDNNYYRVIIAISTTEESKNVLESSFNINEINYYPKTINVNKSLYKELNNYNTLLINTKNTEVIETINKAMLEIFKNNLII